MEMRVRRWYMPFVKNDNVPLKWIEKWSHKHNIHIDTRTVFRRIIKTTQDTHLRWFQYRLIYRILPSRRLWGGHELEDSWCHTVWTSVTTVDVFSNIHIRCWAEQVLNFATTSFYTVEHAWGFFSSSSWPLKKEKRKTTDKLNLAKSTLT